MENFSQLIQSGNAWVFIPSAILLGALHGLEPGHSKTMMAAFIVAVRGTVGQAVVLGLAATVSHTAIVWAVAMGGLYFGRNWSAETTEPYFQVASAVLIIVIALWMLRRTYREQQRERVESSRDRGHQHAHDEQMHRVDTGHGVVDLQIFEDDVPPRFRVSFEAKATVPQGLTVSIETERLDGTRHGFVVVNKGSYFESVDEIPEPHEFTARLSIAHGGHAHLFDVQFAEHEHGSERGEHGLNVSDHGFQDAHERAHANDIKRRFASRNVTTGQIIGFGLRRPDPLPGGGHRVAALPAAEAFRVGRIARAVFQYWSRHHNGFRRRGRCTRAETRIEAFLRLRNVCAACTVCLQRFDHHSGAVCRIPRRAGCHFRRTTKVDERSGVGV